MINNKTILVTGGTGSFGKNNEWMTIEQLQNFLKSPQYRELQDLNK